MISSVPVGAIELINITSISPLVSKCQIKVCYVGDEPNRNLSVITKEVAKDLANSLPGSPIVGYYNEAKGDFEGHNRIIDISDGMFKIKDTTKPYGFVDLGAKVWFQKFLDEGVEHEYLMTEGYLWTGQYPEAQRILDKGNNQSMELDEEMIDAHWSENDKGEPQFFIINEAIISKLCILGEDVEPCFEGATITAPKVQFSFEDSFKEQLFSMMKQIKDILNEGGASMVLDKEQEAGVEATEVLEEQQIAEPAEPSIAENKAPAAEEPAEEPAEDASIEEPVEEETPAEEPEKEVPAEEPVEEEAPAAVAYVLSEIPEYVELSQRYSELETEYNSLKEQHASLLEFKRQIERKEKEAMIDSFYMLSDEDKKDVRENLDNYSLSDIESKLSVICVRNKVRFDLDEEEVKTAPAVYNLSSESIDDSIPAWIKSVQSVAKSMK